MVNKLKNNTYAFFFFNSRYKSNVKSFETKVVENRNLVLYKKKNVNLNNKKIKKQERTHHPTNFFTVKILEHFLNNDFI